MKPDNIELAVLGAVLACLVIFLLVVIVAQRTQIKGLQNELETRRQL